MRPAHGSCGILKLAGGNRLEVSFKKQLAILKAGKPQFVPAAQAAMSPRGRLGTAQAYSPSFLSSFPRNAAIKAFAGQRGEAYENKRSNPSRDRLYRPSWEPLLPLFS